MSPHHEQWLDLEERTAGWVDAWFRYHIGQDVDSGELEDPAQAIHELAQALAPSVRQDEDAWGLLSRILTFAQLTPIELETRQLAEEHQTFADICLNGQPVTPYSRGQYLYGEDDPHKRRELLTRVAAGHPALDQAWARYRLKQSDLAAAWGYTPLEHFLLGERLNVEQLRHLLRAMGAGMRPAFEARFAENRAAVLGNNRGEPWEDFFTLYLNRWSVDVDRHVPPLDGVDAVRQVARAMDFAVDTITMDLVDRPRKMPGALAWDVRTPNDVRICVKPAGNVANLVLLYHEMGHALHFASIDAQLSYPIRAGLTEGVAETFSFWLESLLADPVYLQEVLGLAAEAATEVMRFERLCTATICTWTSAQALCILDYWTDGPFTGEQLGARLRQYVKQFMGLSFPVGAIRLRPTTLLALSFNTVGYPIAYARLGHLLQQLEAVQRDWWQVPAAVEIVRTYMRRGRKAAFPASMLDVGPFLQRYGDV